jgi:thioredoxin 1
VNRHFPEKEPFMLSRRGLLAVFALVGSLTSAWAAEKPFTTEAFAAAQAGGKSIVVHVFAPWCPTCRAQEPI